MENNTTEQSKPCEHYIPDYDIKFEITTIAANQASTTRNINENGVVFMLEGEIEYSYNEFIDRRFSKNEMFFIPQSAAVYYKGITDCTMLTMYFNNHVDIICDNCIVFSYLNQSWKIDYDFHPLPMTTAISGYTTQVVSYINNGLKCNYLNQLKQKEFFIILRYGYPKSKLIEFFYPILGYRAEFKTMVLKNYHVGMSVGDLAASFGESQTNFSKKFKTEFGETVNQWMRKQKAKRIKLKLSIPSTTISDIIKDFSFVDASHLSRFCHEHFGCTPKTLMQQLRNKKTEVSDSK